MFKTVEHYFKHVLPQEQIALFQLSYEALALRYPEEISFTLDNLVKELSSNEADTNVDTLYNMTLEYLIMGLAEYGVKVNEEELEKIWLEHLMLTYRTLQEVSEYENKDVLLNIIHSAEDTVTALINIVCEVTATEMEYYQDLFSRVEDALIVKLEEVLKGEDDYVIESREINPKLRTLKPHFQYVDNTVLKTFSSNPGSLLLSSILRMYGNRIADDRAGHYTWIFAILVSRDAKGPNDLFDIWDDYFLEESDKLDMTMKVNRTWVELFGEEKREETRVHPTSI